MVIAEFMLPGGGRVFVSPEKVCYLGETDISNTAIHFDSGEEVVVMGSIGDVAMKLRLASTSGTR